MKRFTADSIDFSVITEDSQMYLRALDSSATFQSILTSPGNLYALIEPQQSLQDLLVAERSGDNLLLSLKVGVHNQPVLELQQFFSQDGALHLMRTDGDLLRVASAQSTATTGPLSFMAEPAGSVTEPIAHPAAGLLQALVTPEYMQGPSAKSASAEESMPATQAAPAEMFMAAIAPQSASLQEVMPQITKALDRVGLTVGDIVSGGFTDDPQPLLTGTGTPNSYLVLFDNREPIDEIWVDENGQWSYVLKDIAQGTHVLWVQSTVGENLESPVFGFNLDSVAPARATIESVNEGSVSGNPVGKGEFTSSGNLAFSGHAEVNSSVLIYINNQLALSVPVLSADGSWAFNTDFFSMQNGEYDVSVAAMDPSGNIGPRSQAYSFTIDSLPPNAPVIDLVEDHVGRVQGPLASGDPTDDTLPIISGTAEANSIVNLYNNGDFWGWTIANADGQWTFTPTQALTHGEHKITATASDKAGNVSPLSSEFVLTVITMPLDTPDIPEIVDGAGGITGPLQNGDETDDRNPTLNGTGNAGDTVIIRDNGEEIGSVVIGEDGKWTFTPELEDGDHAISIVIQDEVGRQSDPSPEFIIKVDGETRPETPSIDGSGPGLQEIVDGVGAITGPVNNGDETDDRNPTLNGTGNAGDTVIIRDNGEEIGSVVIGEDGKWTFTPELEDGDHAISIVIQDEVGRQSDPSPEFVIKVDGETRPQTPSIDGSGPGLQEIVDGVGAINGPVNNGDETDDRNPTLNGTGNAGDTVIIRDNGEEIGSVVIGEDGKWTFTPELEDGDHAISIVIQDEVGRQSDPSPEFIIKVDGETRPQTPSIDGSGPGISEAIDDFGPVTGPILNGGETDDRTPTFNGTGNAGDTVIIRDNGEEIGSVVIGEDGKWTFTPELEDGDHAISIIIQDEIGRQSDPSPEFVVKVDGETRPQAPVIESVIDDVGAITGDLIFGDVTDDNRPQLTGHTEPGNRVEIYNHGQLVGEAHVNAEGQWSFTPESDLPDGEYSFTAVAISASGNPGEASEAFDLIIFTGEGPSQVARVLHMGKDSGMSGQDFVTNNGGHSRLVYGELSAALTEGQRLEVSHDGGRTWTTALVDGTNWASQDSTTIAHSSDWTIQTRVVDVSGNAGYVMSQKVTYDNAAPRPSSGGHFEDSELVINLPAMGQQNAPQVGDRVLVFGNRGESYFEHTLTQEDLSNGFVRMEVGQLDSANIAIADAAGNMSSYTNVITSVPPRTPYLVTGDESEIYGTNSRADRFEVSDVGLLDKIKLIEGNGGNDALALTGSDQVLDLSSLSTRLSSIEVFDIKGSGNNTLKISLGDVLDLGLNNMFIGDGRVQVAVWGDAGDVVQLSSLLPNGIDAGEWKLESFATTSGITYDIYVNSTMNAELLVQQGVTVELT